MRKFDRPGRSVARSTEAMVATSHPLATAAGLDMLRRGGTAMDAAIAAAAVLAVVEPAETGIGGDCFALYAPKGQLPPVALNGSGRAPAAASADWYVERGLTRIPDDSAHAVTIPGMIDAWVTLHERFGRLDLAALLEPAIGYAERGYVVHERVAQEWRIAADRLRPCPDAAALFLPGGAVPRTGDVVRNPPLARTLRLVAAKGRAGFYEGELAAAMVAHLRQHGGLHTLEDFAANRPDIVEPIDIVHAGHRVFQLPPNTQGVIALLMLRLLEICGAARHEFLSPERIHLGLEIGRIAYAQRDRLLGDAASSQAVLDLLCDRAALSELAAAADPARVNPRLRPVAAAGANTVYLAVVDRERNVASFINSLFHSFGTGLCPPGTGVLLQNRGTSFRLEEGHPNRIGPGKRPMHTIIPGMVGREGQATLSFGVMGGDYQPMGHAHVLSAVLDHGLDLQEACDAARYMPVGSHAEVEEGIDEATRAALTARGHTVVPAPDPLGGAQMIAIDWEAGTLSGGSDPRKDGCAVGF